MPDSPLYCQELAEEISRIIDDREDFSEAREWLIKSGVDEADKYLVKKMVEILSRYLSKGLVQLTVEEIMTEKEYRDAIRGKGDHEIVMHLSKKLQPFKIYVEFVVKSGLTEIKKIRYEFKAESRVEVKNASLILRDDTIKSISFGSFIASITLYLLKGGYAVKISSIERSLSLPGPINLELLQSR